MHMHTAVSHWWDLLVNPSDIVYTQFSVMICKEINIGCEDKTDGVKAALSRRGDGLSICISTNSSTD